MKIMRFIGIVLALFLAGSPSDTSAQDSGKKYKVYMVSNSHLDTQWRWDVKATIDDYLYNTAVQNLALLEKYPHYVFNFEGAVKYEWIKEYYPHLFERIRKFVADGRWNISGASFEANDPNMPSSESFIRNILLAQEFYKKEFGIKSKDMFLPDCFGFSQVMPTLGHHCGLIGFSTQKLSWRTEPLVGDSKTPFPIGLWEGVDGARIMVALEPGRYSWNEFPEGDLSANEELAESARKSPFGIAYRYYGNKLANGAGDHGGSALPRSIQLLEEGITNGKGPVQLVSATSSQLYEDYMPYGNHPELPVFVGEMPLDVHAPGCYTSQAEMKRYNRRNEQSVCTDNGECKLEEPPSVNSKVDIKQISKHGSKTAGNKNNGVGPFEPKRERNELIKQQHCTDCVAGPFRGIADADVADNKLNDQRGKNHGNDEHNTPEIHAGFTELVFGKWRFGGFNFYIGVINPRSAKRADFFAVRKLNSAFYTVHIVSPF